MPTPELEKQALDRLKDARVWKSMWAPDMREGYFFTAPHRQREVSSTTQPPRTRVQDQTELQTSEGYIATGDFVTEVVNTYMPEAQRWCERGPGMFITADVFSSVEDEVRKQDEQIFEAIKASNLYSEIPKAFNPDLALGTVGLAVQQRRPHMPIEVLGVPLREIEINLGPDGGIDDRFWVRWVRNPYVKSLLPEDAKVPAETLAEIENNPGGRTQIAFGYWRLWDDVSDEVWQHIVLVSDKLAHDVTMKGEGCCPFIVGRFNPSSDWPWGIGPLMQALPDLRQIDELEAQKIQNIELHLSPPITYPNDSFANVENGIEPGFAYPVEQGQAQDIKPIYQATDPQPAMYQHDDMAHRLRKIFFVDFPEQTGDTPPTLGQWLDQMARAQRRIGTPGMPFWREVCMPIFLRFKYLLERQGVIKALEVKGTRVSMRPYNPAQRAAEQQEIATAAQFAQMMSQMFPEEWRMVVDGKETMAAFLQKMRVANLIKFRDEGQVQKFVQMMAPLVGARQKLGGEAPDAAQAGAPAAA